MASTSSPPPAWQAAALARLERLQTPSDEKARYERIRPRNRKVHRLKQIDPVDEVIVHGPSEEELEAEFEHVVRLLEKEAQTIEDAQKENFGRKDQSKLQDLVRITRSKGEACATFLTVPDQDPFTTGNRTERYPNLAYELKLKEQEKVRAAKTEIDESERSAVDHKKEDNLTRTFNPKPAQSAKRSGRGPAGTNPLGTHIKKNELPSLKGRKPRRREGAKAVVLGAPRARSPGSQSGKQLVRHTHRFGSTATR